jgi:5-methylcytosine-specific restriction protein B
MAKQFSWIPLYTELATRLVDWESRQGELIELLERIRAEGYKVVPLTDQDGQGAHFLLKEIDPFTFFGAFNRGIRDEQRLAILTAVKKHLGATAPLPEDFDGIPIVNNQSSWFIAYQKSRKPDDVARLWRVFRLALRDDPLDDQEFLEAFDAALEVRRTNLNLTMGLFWIRPDTFLNLDQVNRKYLKIKLPTDGLSAEFYARTVKSVVAEGKLLVEVSRKAFEEKQANDSPDPELPPENSYWLVGANWEGSDPQDQTPRFLEEGIWQNGYEDKYLEVVRSMQVGDRIAIKSASSQKKNLPFDARGKTVARMTIKAAGTVVANRNDGRTVEVEWDPEFEPKDWYFYQGQRTAWRLRRDDEAARRLIDFIFNGVPQDYDWFMRRKWGRDEEGGEGPKNADRPSPNEVDDDEGMPEPYGVDDILAAGVFLEEAEIRGVLDRLRAKKNLILQGAPGVGKTFLARKLAYALMAQKDDDRIEFVQFHQSYSYDDFVRGYRPLPESDGAFGVQNGVFVDFCRRAAKDPTRRFVFIIDEINRGNLSQIFGELLMLIESDKRDPKYAVPLVYRVQDEPRFYIPPNLYLIGLMNLADRSLALVDYALRRRFAFLTLRAQFGGKQFRTWLAERDMDEALIDLIVRRMTALNDQIAADAMLGENYQIGHSFFCQRDDYKDAKRTWYEEIVETEIAPLLREYWFDNPERAREAREQLLIP